MMIDVMFFEVFKEEEKVLRKCLPEEMQADFTAKTIQEYNSGDCPAKVISIRTQSRIPQKWALLLEGVLTRSTGYDHLETYRKSVKNQAAYGYLPQYCARAVAEHAILVAMALLRKIKTQLKSFDTFGRDGLTGKECQGRDVLVIGVGNIGSQVTDIAKGLGMNVRGVDIKPKLDTIQYVSLSEGVPWADIIVCAVPLTEETRNMLDYKILKKAKHGLILINVARGEITPMEDLKQLLDENILAGLSLDVYQGEEQLADYLRNSKGQENEIIKIACKLNNYENVIFTPHNAFNTEESVYRKAKQSSEAVQEFIKTGNFSHPVPIKSNSEEDN